MAIKIIKKSSLPRPGNCRECSAWDQDKVAAEMKKRGLGRCSRHGCYTPEAGTCNVFQSGGNR